MRAATDRKTVGSYAEDYPTVCRFRKRPANRDWLLNTALGRSRIQPRVSNELRDILYTDVERVRGLLAQLERGVVDAVVETYRSEGPESSPSFVSAFDLGESLVQSRAEQTKSLQDALFLLFEEAATNAGVLSDVPGLHDADAWRDGSLHRDLLPGQLLRCTATTRMIDPVLARERVMRFIELGRVAVQFADGVDVLPAGRSKGQERQQQKAIDAAFAGLMGGMSPQTVERLGVFIEAYFGKQLSVRQFPCGLEAREFSLVGPLLTRPSYLQEEREALFSKYGSAPSEWTMVAQVATVPTAPSSGDNASEGSELGSSEAASGDEMPNRLEFEGIASNMMEMMEHLGVAGGPTYPSVAVTPLAIYRAVPTHPMARVRPSSSG